MGPATPDIVGGERMAESVERSWWWLETQLSAEDFEIPQHDPAPELVAVAGGEQQTIWSVFTIEPPEVFPQFQGEWYCPLFSSFTHNGQEQIVEVYLWDVER